MLGKFYDMHYCFPDDHFIMALRSVSCLLVNSQRCVLFTASRSQKNAVGSPLGQNSSLFYTVHVSSCTCMHIVLFQTCILVEHGHVCQAKKKKFHHNCNPYSYSFLLLYAKPSEAIY